MEAYCYIACSPFYPSKNLSKVIFRMISVYPIPNNSVAALCFNK